MNMIKMEGRNKMRTNTNITTMYMMNTTMCNAMYMQMTMMQRKMAVFSMPYVT